MYVPKGSNNPLHLLAVDEAVLLTPCSGWSRASAELCRHIYPKSSPHQLHLSFIPSCRFVWCSMKSWMQFPGCLLRQGGETTPGQLWFLPAGVACCFRRNGGFVYECAFPSIITFAMHDYSLVEPHDRDPTVLDKLECLLSETLSAPCLTLACLRFFRWQGSLFMSRSFVPSSAETTQYLACFHAQNKLLVAHGTELASIIAHSSWFIWVIKEWCDGRCIV